MLRHSPGCGVRLATEEPRSQSPLTITLTERPSRDRAAAADYFFASAQACIKESMCFL
jgi:hypothetical protein